MKNNMNRSKVFISYSHKDTQLAEQLVDVLNRFGIPFLIDRVVLSPGDSLTQKLGDALDQTGYLVVLLSKSSISSEWVNRELTLVNDMGLRIIAIRCDESQWSSRIKLTLGDIFYVDGRDIDHMIGIVPKILYNCFSGLLPHYKNNFLKLSSRERAPYAGYFSGAIQTALEEIAIGNITLVVSTNQNVNLFGKITSSVLDFFSLRPGELAPNPTFIRSRDISKLVVIKYKNLNVHLIASTVFNDSGQPQAEDQWRSSEAILNFSKENGSNFVLIPPLGTGAYRWPRKAALQHWLFGAIQWVKRNPLLTEESVWPIICLPGLGTQKMFSKYLDSISKERMHNLENGILLLKVHYKGIPSLPIYVKKDTFIGSVVGEAFPELRHRGDICVQPNWADAIGRTKFTYNVHTPLNKTIFADGDELFVSG